METNQEKTVLVVGASSGIGRACALHLARRGYRVLGTTRRSESDVEADLRRELASSDRLEIIAMDVDEEASVAAGVREVAERAGRIEGVINCAGFGFGGSIEDTADDEAKATFETNFFGTLRVCRAVLPIMREQRSGTIINISSIGGRIAVPFVGLYGASKFAIEGLTEALRMEVARFGIRVVLVEPGDFATGFTDHRRPVRGASENAVYADAYRAALAVIERDERGGASPEAIGRLVTRILSARSPRLRYTVGPIFQRVAVRLKSILPSRLFGWALGQYYRVG
jgi:NAD(P)-dependent dehydrogenase (short-subunit alcohol dehydrogenase family)